MRFRWLDFVRIKEADKHVAVVLGGTESEFGEIYVLIWADGGLTQMHVDHLVEAWPKCQCVSCSAARFSRKLRGRSPVA